MPINGKDLKMGHEKDLVNELHSKKSKEEKLIEVRDEKGNLLYYTSKEYLEGYVSESKP
jgi:hypothetical protein